MKSSVFFFVAMVALVIGCKKTEKSSSAENTSQDSTLPAQEAQTTAQSSVPDFSPETTDESSAQSIRNFLLKALAKDLNLLSSKDRTFSFYALDLNEDQKDEYLVSLQGAYFCGTGGCSFYLLNHDFTVNTEFTVTRPPFFRSSEITNGWHNLILIGDRDSQGGSTNFIHLKFDKAKKQYPSNPSLVKKTTIAPSGSDFVMWSDEFSRAKPFTF